MWRRWTNITELECIVDKKQIIKTKHFEKKFLCWQLIVAEKQHSHYFKK